MTRMQRTPSRMVAASLLTFGLAATPTLAEPMVTDRPDQTESTSIVSVGRVQIETGWLSSREREGGVRVDTDAIGGTLARIGLVERLELRVGWDGYLRQDVRVGSLGLDLDGAGDASIGAKLHLREGIGRAPDVALLAAGSLPTGDDAFTSDRVDPSLRIAFSQSLSERVGLGYNVGATWNTVIDGTGDRDTLSRYLYTASIAIGATERLGAFVEVFGDVSGSAGGKPAHSLDGGATYVLRENVQFDVAAGVGLSDNAEDWFVGAGVSFRLPR